MKRLSIFLIGLFTMGIIPAASAQSDAFPDVSDTHMNTEAIYFLKDTGVVEGYPDGQYKPSNKINRAEFVKIIMGSAYDYDPEEEASENKFSTEGLNFSDIEEGQWYIPYLRKAVENNVIGGYPDGTFRPAEEINFPEAAKILANSYELGGQELEGERWYQDYIEALEEEEAIPLSVLYFDEEVDRDEMAEMIWRLIEDVDDKATRTYDEIIGEGFVTVDSCADLTARYEEHNQYYGYMYRDGLGAGIDDFALMEEAEAPAAAPADSEAGTTGAAKQAVSSDENGAEDYSSTNIQVAGVDEADVIKNDGKYIYLIKGDTIRIVDAYPADNMEELVNISLGDENEYFYPQEMYVDGDTLTVIGSITREYPALLEGEESMIYPPYNYVNRTKVYVVDVEDRTAPSVERTVEFDGSYSTSRKVNDTLYMVMNQYAYVPYYYYDTEYEVTSDEIVPQMMDSKYGEDEFIAPCSEIMILPKDPDFNFLITAAVPLADTDADVVRNVLVGNSENVYASRNNMYIAATDWSGGYYQDSWDTALYRFSLGINSIKYEAKGAVPGTVLNQFSMDENGDYFRIATTIDEWDGDFQTTNSMYVLDSDDMEIVGDLENIAPGEEIYSVRFMGDKAYMVTFERIDPLFVIGLEDPTDPEILGELKIPGFSNYLHPYDEDHLIGFGKEVDAGDTDMDDDDFNLWQQVQGMKVGLFDVSDVNNPKELFTEVIGDQGTYSELLYNHKALLFDKEKELLAFPISVYEYQDVDNCQDYRYSNCPDSCRALCVPSSCTFEEGITVCTTDCDGRNSCVQEEFEYGQKVFEGAYVYNLNLEDGFELKGKINHHDEDDLLDLSETGWVDYTKAIERIIYIGENLYTISMHGVKANAMDDLEELNFIELAGDVYDIFYDDIMPIIPL